MRKKPQHSISRRKFIARMAAAGTALSVAPADVEAKQSKRPHPSQFLSISHHGAAKVYPENTIKACDWAVSHQGANAIEIDVCFSKDLKVFLWHDWSPNAADALAREAGLQPDNLYRPRVPSIGSRWRKSVDDLSLAEIREHFGYEKITTRCYADDGAAPFNDEVAIPTLMEFVAWARSKPALRCIFLDIKMPCSDESRAASMLDIIHGCFHLAGNAKPRCELVLMVPDEAVLKTMIKRNEDRGYGMKFSWDVEFPVGVVVNPQRFSAIDHAVQLKLRTASVGRPTALTLFSWAVYQSVIEYDVRRWREVRAAASGDKSIDMLVAWTVNDREELEWLVEQGVSGIITDEIRLLNSLVKGAARA